MGPKKPKVDKSAEKARKEAEAKAREEAAALKAKEEEDRLALARGLRGKRALLSSAGGSLGFPASLGA